MKKVGKLLCMIAALMLLAGCGEEDAPIMDPSREWKDPEDNIPVIEEEAEMEETDALSEYSSEQIEYARVWLQLGPNEEIDGLYVQQIPAGTPLNPDDDTSAAYPEPVIQLAGSRLVDGSVTYSSNGDGTINVYNVPLRWDGEYPAGEEFYNEIIEGTELVAIEPGEDERVIRLIELLEIEE
ncbi:putative lipoprotein [Planococcus antarcticus DSM 14505]|uniref:Lipoprotein n=1 Tax=Planococcus antarcticus DSM 14505 TaxID=1185653 RepID=A0A1C7DK84_9BACL|nr:hypothetical protein [Planococcus antarcticus]ANU11990.1 hypothetical protein BBH88_17880 [Planococcus antarcticus DSM 14505]EIM07971.1 putative lipoprotein [Planococcus antarcticus DSM 14505]